ncbi:uncharacterized protein LOC126893426 [Diabrotica virgifera virgifera]|uniref:Ig-like domain-containing protein n=1 Tax=Diabrotica virgifera virgifera TaxID=50390 RepID=A0ABM5LAU9_DIAVI|nr:uncharacterized protein LOC126893426 [Diabrotica virgifera virgifera]
MEKNSSKSKLLEKLAEGGQGPVWAVVPLDRWMVNLNLGLPRIFPSDFANRVVAPVIKVPNQLLGAPVSTDVQLECYVEAYPNTVNYWIKNRGEMLLNGSKYSIKEERSGYKVFMWLVIRSFSSSDSGTYNCVSTNSLGKAEGTLRLYEIKVGPDHHNNNVVVGGLAEPARGHRASTALATTFVSPCLIVVSSTLVELFWR